MYNLNVYQFRAKVRGILHKLVLLFALKRFALKLLDKSNEIEQEIDLLRKLNNHKHIVKYVDDFIIFIIKTIEIFLFKLIFLYKFKL